MVRGRKQTHSPATRYVIEVLWLCGYSPRQIGAVVDLRSKQVQGIIAASQHPKRKDMSIEARQVALDDLAARRMTESGPLDGGLLERVPFRVLSASRAKKGVTANSRQKTVIEQIKEGDIPHGFGERPRDIYQIDQRRAVALNANVAPLEWLALRGRLAHRRDYDRAGQIRFETARWYRRHIEVAQIKGLRSPDYGGSVSSGSGPVEVRDWVVHAMEYLDRLHKSMPATEVALLRAVIADDEWVWERYRGPDRRRVFDLIMRGLDRLCVYRGQLTDDVFRRRWPGQPFHPLGEPMLYDPERLP